MSDTVKIGQVVPDFQMDVYDPRSGEFGTFSLADARKKGQWTVLVFYPADYTFVCPTELADVARRSSSLAIKGELISIDHFGTGCTISHPFYT
jgi:peroxiredoxin (alkyl hydroperoxide reductase subunit C)